MRTRNLGGQHGFRARQLAVYNSLETFSLEPTALLSSQRRGRFPERRRVRYNQEFHLF